MRELSESRERERNSKMAQVSKICSNGAQSTNLLPNIYKPQIPKSFNSISLKSQLLGSSNCLSLKLKNGFVGNCAVGKLRVGPLRVSASVATAEKPSTVPEIVLQPIKEISGTITLPGSKSLSNRILLIAALSEVHKDCGFAVNFNVNFNDRI